VYRPDKRFFLNKRDSKLFGVCSGIADKMGIEPIWVRVAMVTLTIFVSFITIPIYVIIALMADARPPSLYNHADPEEERFWSTRHRTSERSRRARADLTEMDHRLADIEAIYRRGLTSRLTGEIDRLR
jgi:phage shock protein C